MPGNFPHVLDTITRYLDLAGVFACALLGGVVARAGRLDLFGFLAVGIVSGLGGGVIRDTLLQHGTPVALTDAAYLPTAVVGAMVAFTVSIGEEGWKRLFLVLDAAVIGFWAVTGAQKTLAVGLGWLPAILLGITTAVGGGACRDLVLLRVPSVFADSGLYASVAAVVAAVMVLCSYLHLPALGIVLGILLALVLRITAVRRGWGLPQGRDWRPQTAFAPLSVAVSPITRFLPTIRRSTMSDSVTTVLDGLSAVRGPAEDFYKDLHAHPELGLQEYRTSRRVAERLRRWGYDVTAGLGGTGVVATLANGEGPSVLLRADMDALPVEEATGLPYASSVTTTDQNGDERPVMHACGHDMHVTCMLTFAYLMAHAKHAWRGTLLVLFQPSEENGDGASAMVDDGLASKITKPDVALAQHVFPYPSGYLGTRAGSALAAEDSLRITVYGHGTHGSEPQNGVDPVVLAAMIVVRLQTVVSREVAPTDPAVLTVGSITSGVSPNVIPESATFQVNVRTYDDKVRKQVLEAIQRIVRAECTASLSPKEPEFTQVNAFPPTINDPETTARVADAFKTYFGDAAHDMDLMMGSEDFSKIPRALGVPFTYWGFGGTDPATYAAAEKKGTIEQDIPVNHNPSFAPVVQPTLDTGVKALVVASLAWLQGART